MRPWLTWNVLFRLHERLKGHATLRILREMEAADRLSPDELARLRNDKLRDLLDYAYAHVPYVKAAMQTAGIAPEHIRSSADLVRLPLMTKADVRNNRDRLRSDAAGPLSSLATGGSTGEPLIFDLAKRRVASRVACRQRVSRWWGLSVGDPEVALWGSPVELSRQDWIRNVRDRLFSTRLLPAFEMNEPTMSRYLDLMESEPCRQIFGYPSAIYLLCLHARRQRRPLRNLGVKAVFVTGEVLLSYQRELISDTFACPVADGYGGRDSGFVSHECPQGGMHIMADAVIVEVVDDEGRPLPPGQAGQIVVTDLHSHEAPFLRYATGDIGVLSSRRCACGRALPLLEQIDGRANDSVVTPDGRVINSLSLVYPIRELAGVEQFRICQKTPDRFHVQLVRNDDFPEDGADRISKAWMKLFRAPLQITFEYPAHLPHERAGKFRHIVSEVPAGRLPQQNAGPLPLTEPAHEADVTKAR